MIQLKARHGFSSPEGRFTQGDEFTATPPRAAYLVRGGFAVRIGAPDPPPTTPAQPKAPRRRK